MSKKPDLSQLFKMLSEEKAKKSVEQSKKTNKSKKRQKHFMEEFSLELKKLKEQEEQQKRDVAAMEAWLTSPVEVVNEEAKLEVEVTEEPVAEIEPAVETIQEEVEEEVELVAETPLQEQALKYLNTKREEITEEQKKTLSKISQ